MEVNQIVVQLKKTQDCKSTVLQFKAQIKFKKEKKDIPTLCPWGFPGGSDSKESTRNVGDPGSIPGLGRSPGEGNSNPLPYSGLENSMDRGAWWALVHGVTKSWTWLSD